MTDLQADSLQEQAFLLNGLANLADLYRRNNKDIEPAEKDSIEYFITTAQTYLAKNIKRLSDTIK